ncbi:hypothetical protein ARMGADRAFT_1079863 [Armillaria gallica]|uniref:F-box domain-containing protein n=1 Tax=Armillaria gallica TaxID=47427 RepID=A0A2H3E1G8_ARMGA|nr:hypothetical protein ARMGADRAFT_1079863 [Armillaria gallica]
MCYSAALLSSLYSDHQFATRVAQWLKALIIWSSAPSNQMLVSGLLPELLDDIIGELQGDKKSLLGASLACKALCPRTRVHLFSVVALSGKSACDRLRGLITLSPKLALHFRTLYNILNVQNDDASAVYGALTVIESLVNITDLSLLAGDWCHVQDRVVSTLQSREICSLLKNSPGLQYMMFTRGTAMEECGLDHSLHCTPAPVVLRIGQSFDSGTFMKWATSARPCPFSFNNLHTLDITLPDYNDTASQHLYQYLALPATALKHLYVTHEILDIGILDASTRTLNVSGVENIAATIIMAPTVHLVFQVFEWWISNFSAVNKHCAIRCITFKVTLDLNQPPSRGEHPALKWEDLWKRLDDCLTSYNMALLKRVTITFEPRPPEWDLMKIQMESNFPELKRLGRELILEAQDYDEMAWVNRY